MPQERSLLEEAQAAIRVAIEHLSRFPSVVDDPEVFRWAMMALRQATLAQVDLEQALDRLVEEAREA